MNVNLSGSRPKVFVKTLAVTTLALLMVTSGLSCATSCPYGSFTSTLEVAFNKTTLDEASSILGVNVPAPAYLPKGLKIQEVYIDPDTEVCILISDEGIGEKKLETYTVYAGDTPYLTSQRYVFQCKMKLFVRWLDQGGVGLKIPGERVNIGGRTGVIRDHETLYALWWYWRPDPGEDGEFEMILFASKDIPKEELVKVAESVSLPPYLSLRSSWMR